MAKSPRKAPRPARAARTARSPRGARASKPKPAPKAAKGSTAARPGPAARKARKPARDIKPVKRAGPAAPRPKKPALPPVVAGRDLSGRGAKFAIEAARLMDGLRCTDVLVLDVRGKSGVTDYLVVASGTSDRQMRSVADAVADLGGMMDHTAFRTDGDTRSTWLVLDCVDVVVHLFEPSTRTYYDLETMWGDAPRVDWARPAGEDGARPAPRPRSVTRYEDQPSN